MACRRDDAHQLPVPGGRVLALRALDEAARERGRAGLRRTALERLDVAEPERLEVRQVEAAHGAGDVPERVRPLVAVLVGVRQLARADGVEHDHAGAGHAAIVAPSWTHVLGLLGLVVFIVGVIGFAARRDVRRDQGLPCRGPAEEGRSRQRRQS